MRFNIAQKVAGAAVWKVSRTTALTRPTLCGWQLSLTLSRKYAVVADRIRLPANTALRYAVNNCSNPITLSSEMRYIATEIAETADRNMVAMGNTTSQLLEIIQRRKQKKRLDVKTDTRNHERMTVLPPPIQV